MSVYEKLEDLKNNIPLTKVETADQVIQFTRDTLRLLKMFANDFYGHPVAGDIDQEWKLYKQKWG